MADEEEDDPVVHEIDVFLAKSLVEKLYLLQYPVRSSCMSYDRTPHLTARVKPKQQKLEVEIGLNTESSNYSLIKGEEIAYNTDGGTKTANKDPYFTSDRMDKQVLKSTKVGSEISRYAVGLLRPGELHLTPLHAMVQMRPCFEYLDKHETTAKQAKDEGESQDEEEDVKPLTVRFAKTESDRAKNARLTSFKYLEQKDAEEAWCTVDFHQPDDVEAEEDHQLLFCQDVDNEVMEVSLPPRDYLKFLTPEVTAENRIKPQLPTNVLSIAHLKSLNLIEQVSSLLKNAKVMQFSQMCSLLSATDESAVIRCLQQCAMLVQGCWVVKSELLYPKGSTSANSGVAADILCRGRDYLMWRFTQSRFVVRKDVVAVMKLPNEDVKDMLEQMARMKVAHGWEFSLPYDNTFVTKYPDTAKQQTLLWNTKYQLMLRTLNLQKQEKSKSPGAAVTKEHGTKLPKKSTPSAKTKSADTTVSIDDPSIEPMVVDSGHDHGNNAIELLETDGKYSKTDKKHSSDIVIKNEPLDDDTIMHDSSENSAHKRTPNYTRGLSNQVNNNPVRTPALSASPRPLLFSKNIKLDSRHDNGSPILSARGSGFSPKTIGQSSCTNSQDSGVESLSQNTDIEMIDIENGSAVSQRRTHLNSFVSNPSNMTQSRPAMSNEMLEELGKFVKDKIQRSVMHFVELKRLLLLRQTVCEPGDILCSGVSDEMLEASLQHVGITEIQIKWPHTLSSNSDTSSKKFYAFTKVGDEFDEYREVILNLFKETFSVRKKDIADKCTELLGSQPTMKEFNKLAQELLEKGKGKGNNNWFLKGTLSTQ